MVEVLKGGSLTLRYLDLPPTSHYVFYIYLVVLSPFMLKQLWMETSDSFLERQIRASPSLSPFVRCLSLFAKGLLAESSKGRA